MISLKLKCDRSWAHLKVSTKPLKNPMYVTGKLDVEAANE